MTDTTLKSSTTSQIETEAQNLVNRARNPEQIMLDRALHLFGLCYRGNRASEVMHNCVRIAMHEQGDRFNLEIIKLCNAVDITITDYVHCQAEYLLNNYYK